jgi:peroxisomal 3,2-trans-enoyl-CoA isomerase
MLPGEREREPSSAALPAPWPPAIEQERRLRRSRDAQATDNINRDVIKIEKRGRVVVWTMNQPKKLNCLNVAMLTRMREVFAEAALDSSVDAAVLTGAGRYFSSGAAFGDVGLQPTARLSKLHAAVASLNVGIFHPFIHFPKPLFIAANGPAVGGATTMQLLCDSVLCVAGATFHTPFKQLGITPEGCSTVTFERKMGREGARRMLVKGEKLTAAEAKALGFVDVIVEEGENLVATACTFAEQWVSEGRGRLITDQAQQDQLDTVNRREGQMLADAMFSPRFWQAHLKVPAIISHAMSHAISPVLRLLAKL